MRSVRFVKGHGTENDFVVLPDPDGRLELTGRRVRALCDRRAGIGGDGVLRVVRTAAMGAAAGASAGTEWFMDHRNADGSTAEMCGNGVRVFARYLADSGLVADSADVVVGSRGGPRGVRFEPGGLITVDMGRARVRGCSTVTVDGAPYPGIAVDMGNPHLACVTDVALHTLDLTTPPGHDPALFPHGVNVEFVSPLGPDPDAELDSRVYERGVGETRSCGTGTVAAVVAALRHAGRAAGRCVVRTRGGRLRVTVGPDTTTLTGPAVLVGRGELDAAWWDALD